MRPSRTSLYVGEPLLLTYSIYTQTSVSGLEFANAPQYTGFWVEDLPAPQNQDGQPATVEGISYRRFTVMLKLLFPTRAGRLTIPAASLKVGIPRQSLFDQGHVVQRDTRPITVEVKPIPDEKEELIESVLLALEPDPSLGPIARYTLGRPSSAAAAPSGRSPSG